MGETPITPAELIRAARLERGLSVRELARRLGVSAATISAIENGRTGVSVDRIRAIADALGTSVARLVGEHPGADAPRGAATDVGPAPRRAPGAERATAPAGEQWRVFPPLRIDPVLAAAIDAFVETGYHGATVRSLARRAGMSVPGVYHHYRDKQALLVRALDLTMDELHWRVRAASAEGGTATERVALIVEALALFHTHRRSLAFIGASEMRSIEDPDRIRITESRNQIQYLLDEQIDAAVRDGGLTTAHPRDAGRAIATMCTSLPQWFRADGPVTPEQIAAEYAQFALNLLGHTR
ncbi:helix-turn-helix domain-containing protein [Rhodococcus sp. NPDC058505]|uniref:helix-turn-helix domain-containing protein n=1 Tax=unclassified Rhodococcus (in: high G+C Gram-positive bacteria) TaxID=192944 RepID=UPI003660922A